MTGLERAVQAFFLWLLRQYYPQIVRHGADLPPGPVILVVNHPNGLLDPLVARIAVQRHVVFLAKSTIFAMPVLGLLARAFDAVPIYRAKEADTSQNDKTFAECQRRLAAGQVVCLFPEGVSKTAPQLSPLKTGAARIALAAGADVALVPVGLAYESKERFRSSASVTLGQPLDLQTFLTMDDTHAAARALTDRIGTALGELVLQADDMSTWHGLRKVAGWLGNLGDDVGTRDARAIALARMWQRLRTEDPQAASALTAHVEHLQRDLDRLGVADPLVLRAALQLLPGALVKLLPSLVILPLALLGAALSWPVYRPIGPLAARAAGTETDLVGTIKLLMGLLFLPVWWALLAGIAGSLWGWPAALTVALGAPLLGKLAIVWGEHFDKRVKTLHAAWRVRSQPDTCAAIERQRQALAEQIATHTVLDAGHTSPTPPAVGLGQRGS